MVLKIRSCNKLRNYFNLIAFELIIHFHNKDESNLNLTTKFGLKRTESIHSMFN